eukprot:3006126-Rhodomonas_salina.1
MTDHSSSLCTGTGPDSPEPSESGLSAHATAHVLHAPVLLPMSRALPAVPCSLPCMPCTLSV